MNSGRIAFDSLFAIAAKTVFDEEYEEIRQDHEALGDIVFSAVFEARMKRLLAINKRRKVIEAGKRVAVILLIVTTLFSAVLLMNDEVRAVVKEVFVEWFDGFAWFSASNASSESAILLPQYLPQGYQEVSRIEEVFWTQIIYSNDLGHEVFFEIYPSNTEMGVNNDDVDYAVWQHKGIEYHAMESTSDDEVSQIVWLDQGSLFSLYSFIDIDELRQIAISVK